jgi:hypothetical protein
VECGSHYARALASWSLLTALAGYSYSAPEQRLAFAPRIMPEAFASFFTTGGGWGVFIQRAGRSKALATLDLRWGILELRRFAFDGTTGKGGRIAARVNGVPLGAGLDEGTIVFDQAVRLKAGDRLDVEVT